MISLGLLLSEAFQVNDTDGEVGVQFPIVSVLVLVPVVVDSDADNVTDKGGESDRSINCVIAGVKFVDC
ncbi:MAG: hypothetical protein EZS28_038658 [Streblomastix strix]|uniref:Uncharacterized protein n=1 Tax=Streblomastix strix TaxID=222440 RepID=A0A5J4U7Z5_9EUKA|nr:MAG: hypothetical protein EZS28_038658 [Streblomastix strix]